MNRSRQAGKIGTAGFRTAVQSLTTTMVAVGLLATLLALPASAHPFIRGGQAPVDSLARLTLAMAHGCGTEQAGGGEPTREVALDVPEWMRLVEAEAAEGWHVAIDTTATGTTVVWTAVDAQEAAPDLAFSAVLSGTPGETRYLKVFQGCDGFSYRWVGTPDEPAPDPAIRITLAEPDPAAPPPPVVDEGPVGEPVEPDEPGADETSDTPESPQAGESGEASNGGQRADDRAVGNLVTDADDADGSGLAVAWWITAGVVVAAVLFAGVLIARRGQNTAR